MKFLQSTILRNFYFLGNLHIIDFKKNVCGYNSHNFIIITRKLYKESRKKANNFTFDIKSRFFEDGIIFYFCHKNIVVNYITYFTLNISDY